MFQLTTRYLARAFVSAAHLQARGSLYTDLLARLGDDFLPRPVAELSVSGVTVQRLGAATVSGEWSVVISSESVDVTYAPRVGGTSMSFGAFCAAAARYLSASHAIVGQRANRVAVVREGLAGTSLAELDALAARLLAVRPPPFDGSLFEWDWRVATRVSRAFGGHTELTNTIGSLRRLEVGIAGSDPVDRLFVSTDINTPPQLLDPRFSPEDAADFVTSSEAWHAELEAALQVAIETPKTNVS